MNSFTIRNIEYLTGIKAHTLRIWEHRYKILLPSRKKSKHRIYNNEDLKKILKISYLYHRGYRISSMAKMEKEELDQLALRFNEKNDYTVFINQLIEATLDFNEISFRKTLEQVELHMGFEQGIFLVIYPYLLQIGMFWMVDHALPSQEHFGSNLVRNMLISRIERLPRVPSKDERIMFLYTPPGEVHEIPLLLIQYLYRKNGIRTIYFGCGISSHTIRYFLSHQKVTHLYMHIITYFSEMDLEAYLLECLASFEEVHIVLSGPLVTEITFTHPRLTLLRSLQEIIQYCQ